MKFFKLSPIKTARLEDISELIKLKWTIFKIPQIFDIAELNEAVDTTTANFQFKKKDSYDNYKGICLQSHIERDPDVYTNLDTKYFITQNKTTLLNTPYKNIVHFNKAGKNFENIFADLALRVKLDRGRILVAEPGLVLSQHEDGPLHMTLHIPLVTNGMAHMVIAGEEFHLEADGSIYIANTSLPHFIYNAGTTDRIHITFQITPNSFINNTA